MNCPKPTLHCRRRHHHYYCRRVIICVESISVTFLMEIKLQCAFESRTFKSCYILYTIQNRPIKLTNSSINCCRNSIDSYKFWLRQSLAHIQRLLQNILRPILQTARYTIAWEGGAQVITWSNIGPTWLAIAGDAQHLIGCHLPLEQNNRTFMRRI